MMSGAQYLAVTPFFRWFMFPAVVEGLHPVDLTPIKEPQGRENTMEEEINNPNKKRVLFLEFLRKIKK